MEKTFNWIDMTSEAWEKALEGIDLNKDGKVKIFIHISLKKYIFLDFHE